MMDRPCQPFAALPTICSSQRSRAGRGQKRRQNFRILVSTQNYKESILHAHSYMTLSEAFISGTTLASDFG